MLHWEEAERNRSLQEWREGAARCAANRFTLAGEWRDVAPGAERMLNWVAKIKVGVFKDIKVQLEANESSGGAARRHFVHECALPNEGGLIKVNESIHADLIRRDGEARMARGATGVVVHARHDQASFKSCNVERLHAGDAQGVILAGLDECIPDWERLLERHPEFVAKVAGVTSARDPYRRPADRHIGATEEGEVGHVAANGGGEHVACVWPLQ